MTTTRSINIATRAHNSPGKDGQPCRCGCAPCEDTCCNLSCLTQPLFYCGQLLTDQDLNALLAWAQGKLALARYRDGWGVVCGLDVYCDPTNLGQVTVGPGYAVNCCGDDIIVSEPAPVKVDGTCGQERNPCDEVSAMYEKDPKGGSDPGTEEPCIVDLYIDYATKQTDFAPTLVRGVCGQTGDCVPSRVQETYKLVPRPAAAGSDPAKDEANRWCDEYKQCIGIVDRFEKRFSTKSGADKTDNYSDDDVRKWLLRELDNRPLRHFCFIRDYICRPDTRVGDPAILAPILFFVVQDCRNDFLACACHACRPDPGVPLARIWLTRVGTNGSPKYQVGQIVPYPPYRRMIGPDCWPAPPGKVNAGKTIWHMIGEAQYTLSSLGVRIEKTVAMSPPSTIGQLREMLTCEALACGLLLPLGEPIAIRYLSDDWDRQTGLSLGTVQGRVIGFCEAQAAPQPRKTTEPQEAEQNAPTRLPVDEAATEAAQPRPTTPRSGTGRRR